MGTDNYKIKIILFSVLAIGIIAIACIFALSGGQKKKPGGNDKENRDPEVQGKTEQQGILMMLEEIDLDSSSITAIDLESGEEHSYIFTGGSDIRTKNNRVISATLLKKGNIARITADEDGKLKTLIGSDEVWAYKFIRNLKIDESVRKMETGNSVYRFGNVLKVLNDNEFVPLDSIETYEMDMVDIYGIDNVVYLIKVETGHGYLEVKNADLFYGGTLVYDTGKSCEITEDLRLMLSEGEHRVIFESGVDSVSPGMTVKISNNEETVIDLGQYGPEAPDVAEVVFKISPVGSLLYIDGVQTDWQDQWPEQVALGYHEIEVVLGGYTDYKGSIEVGPEGLTKTITLSKAPVIDEDDLIYDDFEEDEADPSEKYETDNLGNNAGNGNSGTASDDADLSEYSGIDIPDNTSVGEDDGDIETIDGDRPDGDTENNTGNNTGTIDITGDTGDDSELQDTRATFGEMTVFCTDGTEIYIDDVYKGRIAGESLTIPKPIGTIELKLVKQGYVTKKYTLTMDSEEESSIFRFPAMTPEG